MDLTKRQKEIFDYIRRLRGEDRLPADRSRDRQGRRADVLVDRPRPPGEPREDRPAAARPDQASGDRAARRQGQAGDRRQGPAARRPGRGRRADPRRGEHRGVPRGPGGDRRRGGRLHPAGQAATRCATRASSRATTSWSSQADDAADGEIVVALLEDEATVKRFFREKDRIRLQPENTAYKPIRTREAELLGQRGRSLPEGV